LRRLSTRIWLACGDLFIALKRYDASVQCFRRAARLEPGSERIQLRLAWSLWKTGRVQDAERAITRLLDTSPSCTDASLSLAELLREGDRHVEALAVLDRAISFAERDPRLHDGRGMSLVRLGRLDDAIASFRHAFALEGNFAAAAANLGAALVEAQRWEEAVKWNAEAIRLRSDPASAYNLGTALAELDRYVEAEVAFRQAIAFEPRPAGITTRARASLAWCLWKTGRVQDAERAYTGLLGGSPSSPDASLGFAMLLQEQDRDAEALTVLDRAISFEERNPHLYNGRGRCLEALGRLDDATASFRHAVALDGSFVDAVANLGAALCKARRWEEAVKWNGEAFRLQPDGPSAYNLGIALSELNRHVEAEAAFRNAVALEPQLTELATRSRARLALAIGYQGRHKEALEEAESLFSINPGDLAARDALCGALIADGQEERALTLAREAVALHASDTRAYLTLGWAYLASDEADQALTAFERAATLAMRAREGNAGPFYPSAFLEHQAADAGKGAALSALGRHLEAVVIFEQIRVGDPGYFERDLAAAKYYTESQLRLGGDE
jgi:superkiller protein 3